jgi:lambda family phage portal protein
MRAATQQGGETTSWSEGVPVYPASSVTDLTADFLGDWRAADSWMRFDMWRVRNRSRQVERGNPWCIAFKRNMLNNILGFKGFHWNPSILTGEQFGDTTNQEPDDRAIALVKAAVTEFGKKENFTTRKRLSRRMFERMLLSRLMFDGEIIIRKMRGFPDNDYKFAWQMVNPDYLDHNLNKTMDNGNIVKMGIEFEGSWKYPVAYHILKRRPNDNFYNYMQYDQDRYIRVPADEIIHVMIQTEDDEQTRGWPWIFAAIVTLFRLGRYEEAALVNAAIGASRGVYFEKKLPEGFMGDPKEMFDDDPASLTIDLPQGSALELPWQVEAKTVDMRYPDGEYKDFHNSMLLTSGAAFGTSYATTTGDLSQANFVSSRLGQIEEQEHYKSIQQFLIDEVKTPMHEEEVWRLLMNRNILLPIAKYDKFKAVEFAGRRWKFVQPVDDMRARELQMNNLVTAVSDVIAETSQEDTETVFKRIAKDNELMKKYGLVRVTTPAGGAVSTDAEDEVNQPPPAPVVMPGEKKGKKSVD